MTPLNAWITARRHPQLLEILSPGHKNTVLTGGIVRSSHQACSSVGYRLRHDHIASTRLIKKLVSELQGPVPLLRTLVVLKEMVIAIPCSRLPYWCFHYWKTGAAHRAEGGYSVLGEDRTRRA